MWRARKYQVYGEKYYPQRFGFDHAEGYRYIAPGQRYDSGGQIPYLIDGREDRSFRKSFDSFSVIGPWLVTADEIPDPSNLSFWIKVNGEVRQESNTNMLIWDVPKLIEYASTAYTLYPGDILMTGTPEGVALNSPNGKFLKDGDKIEMEIENLGRIENTVKCIKN